MQLLITFWTRDIRCEHEQRRVVDSQIDSIRKLCIVAVGREENWVLMTGSPSLIQEHHRNRTKTEFQ